MSDETGATGTQADPGTQPPAGNVSAQAANADGESTTGQPESISLEDAKKLRSENKSLRTRLNALEEAERQRSEAALSDQERAIAKAKEEARTEVLTKAQQMVRRSELRRALTSAGCTDLELATLAPAFADLAVDDDGNVADLDKAVAAFKTGHPTLFAGRAPGSFDTGTGGGARPTPRTYTREQLRDPKFYAEHRADIDLAAREGRIVAG